MMTDINKRIEAEAREAYASQNELIQKGDKLIQKGETYLAHKIKSDLEDIKERIDKLSIQDKVKLCTYMAKIGEDLLKLQESWNKLTKK